LVKRLSSSLKSPLPEPLATIVTINVFPNKTIDRFNTVIANATQFIENENVKIH
jgi:hypothetical protein